MNATKLKVCHNRRITGHRVFTHLAAPGKTSLDWFYGFKPHLAVNEDAQLLTVTSTPGNTDDRRPVGKRIKHLFGKVFAALFYVCKALAQQLFEADALQLFAKPKRPREKLIDSV
ncbi:transposase [Microcoleus sp. FACHB-68]|uniref:transposase n=1 Tax=Microcoleus sp. FACHB-68 TaxID=2692826 RepID=UPI0032208BDA